MFTYFHLAPDRPQTEAILELRGDSGSLMRPSEDRGRAAAAARADERDRRAARGRTRAPTSCKPPLGGPGILMGGVTGRGPRPSPRGSAAASSEPGATRIALGAEARGDHPPSVSSIASTSSTRYFGVARSRILMSDSIILEHGAPRSGRRHRRRTGPWSRRPPPRHPRDARPGSRPSRSSSTSPSTRAAVL